MDIVLNSRHCELTDRFRSHVEEKLARLEKHDHRVIRVEVEVEKERNPRQADRAVRVGRVARSKHPARSRVDAIEVLVRRAGEAPHLVEVPLIVDDDPLRSGSEDVAVGPTHRLVGSPPSIPAVAPWLPLGASPVAAASWVRVPRPLWMDKHG